MPSDFRAASLLVCVAVLSVAIATLALGAAEPTLIAENSEPHVLNLALPRTFLLHLKSAKGKAQEQEQEIRKVFQDLYCPASSCKGARPLQINIAFGDDYQILDWLGKGWVDAAAVPTLSLYLLNRDHVDLVEMNSNSWRALLAQRLPRRHGAPLDLGNFWETVWRRSDEKNKAAISPPEEQNACSLAVPSHLLGLLGPVEATSLWLNEKLAFEDSKKREDRENRFWNEFFDRVRFTFGSSGRLEAQEPSICAPTSASAKSSPTSRSLAEESPEYRLVISSRRAATIFGDKKFTAATASISTKLPKIFPQPDPKSQEKGRKAAENDRLSVPKAFRPLVFSEPYFRARTFAFTINESLELLRQAQSSKDDMLALVLPGGGVKAGFQSRILETLYDGKLKNYKLRDAASEARADTGPLQVDYIIGTSGGALLGYFLAQLGEKGPRNLWELLWTLEHRGERRVLQSTDVFGFFDLPRYLSFFLIFTVLCTVLWLVPAQWIQREEPASSKPGDARRIWRVRLLLAIGLILLATPIIIRFINGAHAHEHIPEVEGFYYSLLVLIAMFADQCLLIDNQQRETHHRLWWWTSLAVLIVGAVLLLVALGIRLWKPDLSWFQTSLTAAAFILKASTLQVLFYLGALITVSAFAAKLAESCWVTDSSKRAQWRKWWSISTILLFALWTVLLLVYWVLRWYSPNNPWVEGQPLLFLDILEIRLGALMTCLGALALFIGFVALTGCSSRYYFSDRGGFYSGIVGVALTLIALVYVALWLLIWFSPDVLSILELTGQFWRWLSAVALALTAGFLWLSYRPFMPCFFPRGVQYLTANHPNGNVASRRYFRLWLLAAFAVIWWNFIVAPGLYGNKHASESIRNIVGGFDRAFDHAHKSLSQSAYLTARLVVPANVLERDGTRYFLFAPSKDDCPEFVRKPGDGATWRLFYVAEPRMPKIEPSVKRCGTDDSLSDKQYLKKVVFASGSPFPVFPAHRVDDEALVDGGYSNNVPLDAAQTVSADMVLIVESSHPLGPEAAEAPPSPLREFFYPGALIRSLPRLLSFLFERSQQIDRLSRSDLFVVSIAPPREELNWPFLVDFRPKTVYRMRAVAEQNLSRRIAMVQSWGRPHFQLTARLGPGAK